MKTSSSSRRIKVQAPELTYDDVVRITGEIAAAHHALQLDVDQMNKKIDAIKAAHQVRQSAPAEEIKTKTAVLERWAINHREIFGDRRSLDLPRAVIGFRTSTPSVKPVKGMTIGDVIENLLRMPGGDRFVRYPKPELDKQAVLAERDAFSDLFEKVGIQIVQEERFFIEAKAEEVPAHEFN